MDLIKTRCTANSLKPAEIEFFKPEVYICYYCARRLSEQEVQRFLQEGQTSTCSCRPPENSQTVIMPSMTLRKDVL